MPTLEDIEKKRAARRSAHDSARQEQETADLAAIDALEEASGAPLHTMTANAFKPGIPVRAAFRAPTAAEYKRYCDLVGRAATKGDSDARKKAQEQLAASCLVYPAADSDARKAMLEELPGVLISVALEAAKVAELRAEDEGKS